MLDLLEREAGQPDYDLFVESLAPEQAVFLNIVLQGLNRERYLPLREALTNRLLGMSPAELNRVNGTALRAFFDRPPAVQQYNVLNGFHAAAQKEKANGHERPERNRHKSGRGRIRYDQSAAFFEGGIDPESTQSRPKVKTGK